MSPTRLRRRSGGSHALPRGTEATRTRPWRRHDATWTIP